MDVLQRILKGWRMACEQLQNGICRVATSLAGRDVSPAESACKYCLSLERPAQINEVTVSQALAALRSDPDASSRVLAAHGAHLKREHPAAENSSRLQAIATGRGVGSELWRLLESVGVVHTPACPCLRLAEEMNRLGPPGCREQRAVLVAQGGVSAAQYGWTTMVRAAIKSVGNGVVWKINPLDLYGSLLDEAIARAERSGPQQLILVTPLCPGDLLTLTAAIESLHQTYPGEYLTDVRTNHPAIWQGNPHITPIADGTPGARSIQMHYPSINSSNQVNQPFLAGYTDYLSTQLGRPLRLTTARPSLYLTAAEERLTPAALWPDAPDLSPAALGGRRLWLVNAGIKSDYTCKQWPVEYYQAVVDATQDKIAWAQIGLARDNHPRLRHVICLLDSGPPMRELILLARHAAGGLGPVTFLQHLMAAWHKPYVCLVGGREPSTWVQYPKQHTLHTVGQLDCCAYSACWRGRVLPLNDGQEPDKSLCLHPVQELANRTLARPVARCMANLKPDEVIAVLRRV